MQDSQSGGHQEIGTEEGLSDFLFLFYFRTNAFSALVTINGTLLRASDRLTCTVHT